MPKNHKGECGPCALCKKKGRKYNHFGMFPDDIKTTLQADYSTSLLTVHSCICYTCFKRCQRHKTTALKRDIVAKTPRQCQIEHCESEFHSNWHLSDLTEVESFLNERVTGFEIYAGKEGSSIGLCREHYNKLHRRTVPECAFCGTEQRGNLKTNRKCPEPDKINAYLEQILVDVKHSLTASDNLCLKCYKHCRSILARTKKVHTPSCGIDHASLLKIKNSLQAQVSLIRSKSMNSTDFLELVALETALNLANQLETNEVALLLDVYSDFQGRLSNHALLHTSVSMPKVPGQRWLLSRLEFSFDGKIVVECKHRRIGSLIFLEGCDHLHVISTLLGKIKAIPLVEGPTDQSLTVHTPKQCMEEATKIINKCIHTQARALTSEYKDNPKLYLKFSIEKYQQQLDPQLIDFVKAITEPVRNKRELDGDKQTTAKKRRIIRQLYAVSVLLFITDNTCCMPFHIPLVETVLSHGGSHELARVLNRLGACASLETAKRLSTMVVHERICRGIVPELTSNTLTLITIDNIDIQQSHAMVSALDATRSWHGTSIQCIQPMPKSLQEDPVAPVQARKHPLTSPVVSPSKTALAKRRCRTLTEYQSPHSCETIPRTNREGEDKDLASLDNPIATAHTHIASLHHFTVTWADTFSLDSFKCKLFQPVCSALCSALWT